MILIDEQCAPGGGGPASRRDYRRLPGRLASPADGRWHVGHTRPRQEKALAEALVALGIACFVPLVRRIRYYEHRKRVVELPLFPSYAFILGTREQAFEAVRTNRVARLIAVEDQQQLDNELSQIDRALGAGANFDLEMGLAVGRRAVVTRGPFRGLEGLIDDRRAPGRLVLSVSMLGRATSVEIDADLLERVD